MRATAPVLLALLLSPTGFAQNTSSHSAGKPVIVSLINSSGKSVGTAQLSSAPKGVKISLDIKNLPPGQYSVHIHEFAKCDPPDFKSAGSHFDAGGQTHAGHFAGDNSDFSLIVAADGTAQVATTAPNVTLGKDEHSVFSNGGTAIVIHGISRAPGGSAPARVACGAVVRPD
ncbi:MAG TPA: superoxide dismutase family protein [Methylomirabilota bacterium]|nr:superoxide dismutase family protein [Methylomirabilota bacterium]